MTKWLQTVDGAVNSDFVIRLQRDADGTVLHLSNGDVVRSSTMFQVVDGELVETPPIDDDDCPF
ncbi:hypothetical protein [Bradyrhizobium sp. NAS80.1]|uniref:hypothetical protein n=1 Tax=Bradyrhizobium sp. NAS80.1 TaxID=1680159 RepID=UPI001160FE18|nr:hypothetical protein [Bradyrhizobium sp. NAS80.1]